MEEKESKKWFYAFLPLAWSGHIGLGLALGIFGPTQPYLAMNVGTSVDHINFIWTGRSIGFCLTSVVTAMVFKKYCTKTWQKMMFLAIAEIITGIFVICTPLAGSFPVLIGIVTIFGMSLGLFDTADNSLMVYMFGPKKSRPFTQSVHAFVGVGFVFGSLMVQPFLPETNEGDSSVCPGEGDHVTVEYTYKIIGGLPSINWPFIIIGAWHFLTAAGMIFLGFSGLEMPSFYDKEENIEEKASSKLKNIPRWWVYMLLVYVYYVLSCGLEGFFQSMTYTYGLCGPLKMSPSEANLLNGLYFGAFVVGRSSGIFISKMLSPSKIIIISITGCFISSIILSIFASYHKVSLYMGVVIMGFAIAFQFASGISWTAKLFNVTGKASFIFFLGGFSGFLSFPPIAGAIITMEGGQAGFFYLALATTVCQAGLFTVMSLLARKTRSETSQ